MLKAKVAESLKELQTDQVDIFYLHAADRSVPFAETLEAVNELHKEGRFVQFALSNFTSFEVAEIVITCKERGWVRPTLYQAMYNAISALYISHRPHLSLITSDEIRAAAVLTVWRWGGVGGCVCVGLSPLD